MSIKVYTYSNPYEIDCEQFWDEIKEAVQFCASQTMVNGMNHTYPFWNARKQITTIHTLTNSLYSNWDDINIKVKQIMEVDTAINNLATKNSITDIIKRSLLFNTKSIADSLRILSELGLSGKELSKNSLNIDQQYLIDIFCAVQEREHSAFSIEHVNNINVIDSALKQSIIVKNKEAKLNEIDFSTVVIHGIHQFTPTMLCAIEDLSKFKNVILLFNYQPQYQSVYDTWLNIYSLFDKKIISASDNQFTPNPLFVDSYKSNLLGDYFGRLAKGIYSDYNEELGDLEVTEFENVTEFANYVADIFDNAKKQSTKSGNHQPTLSFMKEQLYSASNKVNDILRAFFPDQFGERYFLDYPIGHFFIATTNMWDSDQEKVIVENFSDIRECLGAGIISESTPGVLLSSFDKVLPYFEKENTMEDIIAKLKNLQKYVSSAQPDKARIGYFNISKEKLQELIGALEELNKIIVSFFTGFSQGSDNFRRYYARIQQFFINRVNNKDDLDDEMKSLIQKLLRRLEKSDLPDTGTFTCLKQTMSFYLSQDDNPNKGAQWIVRGFEQIDGDILRSKNQDPQKTSYHFCCLSDKDIFSDKNAKLPWPLDIQFFEYAHIATEQKYRIYVKSKMEYHNFNLYALLYGLVFNRVGCKLSYVKTENDKDNDLFYMLNMLGVKVKKYNSFESCNYYPHLDYSAETSTIENRINSLTNVELEKLKICPYRFILESFVQEKTEYRDRFLVHTYMRVLIANRIIAAKSGEAYNDNDLQNSIFEAYQEICDKFKLADEIERTQLIASVYKDIRDYYIKNNKYRIISDFEKSQNKLKEDLLLTDMKKVNSELPQNLKEFVESGLYLCNHGSHCKYCASKDICLEHNYFQEE